MGSLAPPVLKAVAAVLSFTPPISKIMVPPLIREAQCETLPFPFPILTSLGFFVIGVLGNIFIHILPPFFFIFRLMA